MDKSADAFVLGFGEPLLRVALKTGETEIEQRAKLFLGGAELNTLSALSTWGIATRFCSALPDTVVGGDIQKQIERRGVDISALYFAEGRMGTYYLFQGGDLKTAGLVYDRANSALSQLLPGRLDWQGILENVTHLHLSAITPALNPALTDICKEAVQKAREKGIVISMDLNYRPQLWQDRDPRVVMPELVETCDIVMGNVWSATDLLGMPLRNGGPKAENQEDCIVQFQESTEALFERFPNCKKAAYTFRFANKNGIISYFACLREAEHIHVSKTFRVTEVKDPVGSGDCFMAGLLYGDIHQWSPEKALNFSAAAAVGKLQEMGDATWQTVDDILNNSGK